MRPNEQELREQLVSVTRRFYERGWMPGTAGNVAARLDDATILVSASGLSKGTLTPDDFLKVAIDGPHRVEDEQGRKSSAETSIHQALFAALPDCEASLHVHPMDAVLLTHGNRKQSVAVPPVEVRKVFGIPDDQQDRELAVFENHPEVPLIGRDVGAWLKTRDQTRSLPAFLIRDHGLGCWAESVEQASNYVEVTEYLCRMLVRLSA